MLRLCLVLWMVVKAHLAHSSMRSDWCESDVQGMLQLVKPTHDVPAKGPVAGTEATNLLNTSSPRPEVETEVDKVNITTFQWEPHWQCAEADAACTAAAQQTFLNLVQESGAQIAAALELKDASTVLPDWSSSKEYEDAVSIMVAPGWQVQKEGGGNICCNGQRGLAVMLVKPPFPVANCDQLCLMAVHPGHYPIESGSEIVEDVCGSVRTMCAIALGDWNVDAAGVMGGAFNSWERQVGGNPPVFVVPNAETCCHPSTCCRFDHLATNIPGALANHVKVWDYQLLDQFSMDEEHMPVSVHFTVPLQVALVK